MKNPRGFTLIEVLVVASIISLFSTMVTSSVSSGRQKADNTFKREAIN